MDSPLMPLEGCRKCGVKGAYRLNRPSYIEYTHKDEIRESLIWSCYNCGYKIYTKTLEDARRPTPFAKYVE